MPVEDYLRKLLTRARNSETSHYAWWGWQATCEELEKRVAGFVRHPAGQPVPPAFVAKLRRDLVELKQYLEENRPF